MTSGNMLSSDELCVMLRRRWPLESGCKMQSAFLVQNELSKYELPNCSHLIRFPSTARKKSVLDGRYVNSFKHFQNTVRWFHYHPYFTEKRTEHREVMYLTCPWLHSWKAAELEPNPDLSRSTAGPFCFSQW